MASETRCAQPLGWHLLMCQHGSRVWLPQRCRKCLGCHNNRRAKVIARIGGGLEGRPGSAMLTLTTRPGTPWPDVMRAWSHMVKWLRKRSPELEYAACKEEGSANGMRHLHAILLNLEFTPQAQIARRWRELTGAHVVRVERLRSDRAHYYIAKYVSKDLTAARKHVTFSRGWPKLPAREDRLTHLAELPAFGPSNVRVWTAHPGIVQHMAEGCECWGETHPVTLGEHLWLGYPLDHSLPDSQAS